MSKFSSLEWSSPVVVLGNSWRTAWLEDFCICALHVRMEAQISNRRFGAEIYSSGTMEIYVLDLLP